MRIVPDSRYAVVLLTNGFTGQFLHRDLFGELLGEVGVTMPDRIGPADEPVAFDPASFASDILQLIDRA